MRIPRVYTSQDLQSDTLIELEPGASHHLIKVLRMQEGRELTVFNGQGGEYQATIASSTKKTATIKTTAFRAIDKESPLITTLAIGLSRGERMDWVIQKSTELGVNKIIPLFTERTEVKLTGERLQKRLEHWQKIIIGACEQCQRNRLPELDIPQPLDAFLQAPSSHNNARLKFVLHHRSEHSLDQAANVDSITLLVGPEGGLSENEIEQSELAGYQALSLGPRILRTETAPIVALTALQLNWGDFAPLS